MKFIKTGTIVFQIFMCIFCTCFAISLKKEKNTYIYKEIHIYPDTAKPSVLVTATTYNAIKEQCDNDPHITAYNMLIDLKNPEKHKYIAISRDLQKIFPLGSKILIKGTAEQDGIYLIADLMNKKYKRRIDILIN
ncbi:MAG: hypothetical protein ACRC0V_09875, partial [Fusobacteriaceae bacterium]